MRIRTIKPEFWTSETMAPVSDFGKLLAIGLLNYADDHGYFWANPIKIRAALFPFENDIERVSKAVDELRKADFILLGKASDGRLAGKVVNFATHQRVDRPKDSVISQIVRFDDPSTIDRGLIDDGSLQEGKGGERNGMEQGRGFAEEPRTADELIAKLAASPAYEGIDVKLQYHRMAVWCETNKKKPTERRFVNWLNRCERPLMGAKRNGGPNI